MENSTEIRNKHGDDFGREIVVSADGVYVKI